MEKTEKQIRSIIEAIKAGMFQPSMKGEMDTLEAHNAELTEVLAQAEAPPPLLPPNMAEIYQRPSALYCGLQNQKTTAQTALALRTLVDRIEIIPEGSNLQIVLQGDLAAILRFAANSKNPDVLSEIGVFNDLLSQEILVAGAGFEPAAFRL